MQAHVIATFKQKQCFIADNRDIPRSKKRFLLKIFATGMYEIVWGLTYWPLEVQADMVARLSKFRLTPYGSDPYVHRDGIRKRNYMSRKYSLIIPPPTALKNEYHHTFLRDYLSSARRNVPRPATSSRIYITYSYTRATIEWRNEDGKLADRLSCSSSFSVNFCVATTVTLDAEIPTGRMINWNHFGIFAKRDLIVYLVLTVLCYTVH